MIIYIGNFWELSNPAAGLELIEELKDKYYFKFYSKKKNKILRILDMLYGIMKNKTKANLVLIDTFSTLAIWIAFFCALCCKILNIKYIPIIRGGDFLRAYRSKTLLVKFIFKNAWNIVSPSKYLQIEFEKLGFEIRYIPNGINPDFYISGEKPDRIDKYSLVWVRAFHKIYNPKMAIEVVKILKRDFNNIKLTMIGPDKDGSLNECKNLVENYKLNENIIFTGYLEKKDWIKIARTANIFINTTNIDNHPKSIIEGMLLGLPIVSTNVGGISYLIEEGRESNLIQPNDINGMAKKISIIINDTNLRHKFSKNAKKNALNFSYSNTIPHWHNLLDIAN